jgi:4-hydroxybenzoate polyprenyltransferase
MRDQSPADASNNNWVNQFLPTPFIPYARLARLDRPIGSWLLFWPCLWGVWLAQLETGLIPLSQTFYISALFAVGAIVMRGAGCTYNDIVDRDYDGKVERTRNRPLPAGQITVKQAWAFLIVQCLIGLCVLLQFNIQTIILGVLSLAPIAIYPFMKRFTWWPQLFLGIAFNWGVFMGYAASAGNLSVTVGLVYVAAIFWTIGYDTIYAHQDREDDDLIGLKSSAIRLGDKTYIALWVIYGLSVLSFLAAGLMAFAGLWFYLIMGAVALHLAWQVLNTDINDSDKCLDVFKSNRILGFIIMMAFALSL